MGGGWETCLNWVKVRFLARRLWYPWKPGGFGFRQFSSETKAVKVIHDEKDDESVTRFPA